MNVAQMKPNVKDDKLIACSNRQKIATEYEYGCVTAEANAYCRECKDDEKKCEKGFIVSCTKDVEKIGRWDDDHKQRCENGCFPGARGSGSEVSCYECGDADKLKCFRDDETKVTTIKRCLAHNWHDEEVCALGCVEGSEAKCKICNHGDKKFYNHFGFDVLRIGKAMLTNIKTGHIVQGASTITQQFVKNLYLEFDKTWEITEIRKKKISSILFLTTAL